RRTRFVLTAQESAGERYARENAEIVLSRAREVVRLGAAVQTVVDNLEHFGTDTPCLTGLVLAALAEYGDSEVPDSPESLLLNEHGPQLIIIEGFVRGGVELIKVDSF